MGNSADLLRPFTVRLGSPSPRSHGFGELLRQPINVLPPSSMASAINCRRAGVGQLPGLKMGRMWRISKDTIQKIESGEIKIEDPDGDGDAE